MQIVLLLRLAGLSALLAGGIRVASSFIPYEAGSTSLEALYLMTDLLLLFGLIGVYARDASHLGVMGLAGFVLATSGIASIVGPDTHIAGIDTYQTGVTVIGIGLVILSIQQLVTRAMALAPCLWIASFCLGALGPLLGWEPSSFMLAGILFGLGFAAAGFNLLRRANWLSDMD